MASYKIIVKNAKVILKTVTNAVLNITGIRDLLTGSGSVDSNTKIDWTLQHYTNTAANFTSINPTLLVGQVGIETDDLLTAPKYKIGDGVTAWNTLPYNSSGGGGLSGLTTNKVLKAGSATTAVDSNITDDVSGVTAASPNGNNTLYSYDTVIGFGYSGAKTSEVYSNDTSTKVKHEDLIELAAPSVTKNGIEVATVNDIPSYPTTYDLFITTGNQTTTSNVASNITGLVSPTLTSNKRYKISGVIHFGCNNSGGVKYQITVPSGATLWVMGHSNLTNANSITWTPVLSSATLSPSFAGVNNADYGALCIDGEISIGATAGVIQFGFASATNTQTSTVYQLGTQLTLTQIN